MRRRRWLGLMNAATLLITIAAAAAGLSRHRAVETQPLGVEVSVIGEREREPGLWDGLDLTGAESAVQVGDRLRVLVETDRPTRLWVYAREADGGLVTLHSAERTLRPGQGYVLPGPHRSYGVTGGPVELLLLASPAPLTSLGGPTPSAPWVDALVQRVADETETALHKDGWTSRLSDGSASESSVVGLVGPGLVAWRLRLSALGGAGAAEPPMPPPYAGAVDSLAAAAGRAGGAP